MEKADGEIGVLGWAERARCGPGRHSRDIFPKHHDVMHAIDGF